MVIDGSCFEYNVKKHKDKFLNRYQFYKRKRKHGICIYKLFPVVLLLFFLIKNGSGYISGKVEQFCIKGFENVRAKAMNFMISAEAYEEKNLPDDFSIQKLAFKTMYPASGLISEKSVEEADDSVKVPAVFVDEPGNLTSDGLRRLEDAKTAKQPKDSTELSNDINSSEEVERKEETPETADTDYMCQAKEVFGESLLTDYDFVIKNFYVVPEVTTLRREILNLNQMLSMDLSIKDKKPTVLIFHTHSQERFADSDVTGKTIVDAGEYLGELLTQKGFNIIHLRDEFDIKGGVLDRSSAYTYANEKLDEVLADNPDIDIIIDLHRDGVDESKRLITEINGKQTAKIMLFNGISYTNEQGELENLYNPFLSENLALTYQLNLLGKMNYPDFIRCIYISGYRYCLYHRARSLLIEAGAQNNTFEEVKNAMEPLAVLLDMEFNKN